MKWLRWIGITIAAVIASAAAAVFAFYTIGGRKLARRVDADVRPLASPTDSVSIAEGGRMTRSSSAPSATGSISKARRSSTIGCSAGWFLRTSARERQRDGGVHDPDVDSGHPSWNRWRRSPAGHHAASKYNTLIGEEDLANLVAFLQHGAETVDHDPGKTELKLARSCWDLASSISSSTRSITRTRAGEAARRTRWRRANTSCTCVVAAMVESDGRHEMGGPPLARGSALEAYDERLHDRLSFRSRTERTVARSRRMPWKLLGRLTDAELHAVWTYIRTVPSVEP